ncbi:50S ribosomal protein L25 [Patescibacteria group bacterium]
MELKAEKREIFGKKNRLLREERLLPAVIFGKGLESISIVIDYNSFVKVFKEAGETTVIDIMVEDEKHPVLVKDIQHHHITYKPIHIGFYEVNLKEKLTANIPVEVINEEENELVKSGEALVLTLLNEIEVEALPTDLPESFIIDALKLVDMDSLITVADLEFDKDKVKIEDLEPDEIVAKLDHAQMLEEEEEEVVDEADAIADLEATQEKEPGEEDAEGDASEGEEKKEAPKED